MNRFMRTLMALVAVAVATITVTTPASAAVDLSVKQAIVSVVLDNLGVQASEALITEIAGNIDPSELSNDLCESVGSLLVSGADPRSTIEGATDVNGDGVPDVGAALNTPSGKANPNATEKDDNSVDKSTNSSNRSTTGTTNSSSGGNSSSSSGSGSSSGNSDDDSDGDDSDDDSSESEDDD